MQAGTQAGRQVGQVGRSKINFYAICFQQKITVSCFWLGSAKILKIKELHSSFIKISIKLNFTALGRQVLSSGLCSKLINFNALESSWVLSKVLTQCTYEPLATRIPTQVVNNMLCRVTRWFNYLMNIWPFGTMKICSIA